MFSKIAQEREEAKIFYTKLTQEILKNEKLRVTLLAVVFGITLLVLSFIVFLNYTELNFFLKDLTPLYVNMGIIGFLMVREILIRRMLNKKLKEGSNLPSGLRLTNVFLEANIPTIIFIVFFFYTKSIYVLITPIGFLYFIIIILSILSLEPVISLFTSIFSSAAYMLIIFFVLANYELPKDPGILAEEFLYIGRGLILLIGGLLSTFVSYLLRKRIIASYNLIEERNKIVNLFDQQVSKEIVDELISSGEELKSKRKFVCVMFLDVRGFTPIAEKKKPEEIIEYQNSLFGFMIEIITKHNGIINQFLGDGYMATFGAPISKGNDCMNAVNASLEIVNELNKRIENGLLEKTRIGIGLHAGSVIAGNVGTNVRKQYSISGNTVILASRIEELNKQFGSQVLISEEVLKEIDESIIDFEYLGEVQVKGRLKPIKVIKLA